MARSYDPVGNTRSIIVAIVGMAYLAVGIQAIATGTLEWRSRRSPMVLLQGSDARTHGAAIVLLALACVGWALYPWIRQGTGARLAVEEWVVGLLVAGGISVATAFLFVGVPSLLLFGLGGLMAIVGLIAGLAGAFVPSLT